MYNANCELRETHGREVGEVISGRVLKKFKAKVFKNTTNSGFEGTATASNGYLLSIQFKHFGVEIVPNTHTIVVEDRGYIVATASPINANSGRLINGKTIWRVTLE